MRPVLLASLLALPAGCGQAPTGESVREVDLTAPAETARMIKIQTKGRVIDTADVLSVAEEQGIAERLALLQRNAGRSVVVVTVSPEGNDSMERIGWAVGGATGKDRPLLMLVDPERKQVRIEGDLPATQRAAVAAPMQPELLAGRTRQAIDRGLDGVERLGS